MKTEAIAAVSERVARVVAFLAMIRMMDSAKPGEFVLSFVLTVAAGLFVNYATRRVVGFVLEPLSNDWEPK